MKIAFVLPSSSYPVLSSQEAATTFRIYRNELEQRVAATQIVQDLASDPTLPRTKDARCPKCGHGEAVFFQVRHAHFAPSLPFK